MRLSDQQDVNFARSTIVFLSIIPICNQTVAYWYKGGGNRRPQVFENAGFPSFFKNFGVSVQMQFERNLVFSAKTESQSQNLSFATGSIDTALSIFSILPIRP